MKRKGSLALWQMKRNRTCLLYTSKNAGVELDRKVLSDMAINDPQAFAALAEIAKEATTVKQAK